MILETHDRLRASARSNATRLVVYDDRGNPIAVFLQRTPDHVHFRHKGQPGFEEALRVLGIKDTSIVEIVHATDFKV